ncbi:hypothetical protein MY3296_001887 [Beauveria thailandica]
MGDIDTDRLSVEELQTNTEVADRKQLLDDFKTATVDYRLCPNRVWAVAKDDLPRLLPNCKLEFRMPSTTTDAGVDDADHHSSCTFEFCELSQRDFTAVQQRHECLDKDNCRPLGGLFSRVVLEDACIKGLSTVWALDGVDMLKAPRPYMAISHVWSDGTGTGTWKAGQVNECLYQFFHSIAERFGCEGIWWDTICIPEEKKARQNAIHRIQNNYQGAAITLIHDCFLRKWPWDPETACFGILMSPWFSRGWTALELAKSRKVKVIFQGKYGPVIKDLDQDILAGEGHSTTPRELASSIIHHLRKDIRDLKGLLMALGSRSTSWPKDRAIISALMLDIKPGKTQQDTYQRILMAIGRLAPGNLFHNSATMSNGFEWCSASPWSMPLDPATPSLEILDDGDLMGSWRISSVDASLESCFSSGGTHRLIEQRVRHALQSRKDCQLLAEVDKTTIGRALVVTPIIKAPSEALYGTQRYELVGGVYLHPPLRVDKWKKLKIRLAGDVSGKSKVWRAGDEMSLHQSAKTLHQAALTGDMVAFKRLMGAGEQQFPDELGQLPIHIAAERGNLEMVKCLAALPKSRGKCQRGQTAMHRGAWGGSVEVVQLLAHHGFNVSLEDDQGNSPLHIAAELGNEAIVGFLVTQDSVQDGDMNNKPSPLHYAAMSGGFNSVRCLVDAKASKQGRDGFGWTPLHYAAGSGDLDVVRLLLSGLEGGKKGIDDYVNCKDTTHGWTPLHFAAMSGSHDMVDLLVDLGADQNVKDGKGWAPRHFADMNQSQLVFPRLADQEPDLGSICRDLDNITPLHCLAINMRQGSVRTLVKRAAELSWLSKGNRSNIWSPLLLAVEQRLELALPRLLRFTEQDQMAMRSLMGTLIETAIKRKYTDVLRHLICTQYMQGQDPQELLSLAVECGHTGAVELLLNDGGASAKPDQRLLHLASHLGKDKIAKILLSKGAYVDGIVDGRSPLSVAAESGHATLVKLLLDQGAHIDLPANDDARKTPLAYAAANGELAAVQVLLQGKAAIEGCKPVATPLCHAAENGHEAVVRLLLEKGAMIETPAAYYSCEYAEGEELGTPLALAARGGHITIMKMLLRRGAKVGGYQEISTRGPCYGVPLSLASEKGQVEAVQLLISEGAKEHLPGLFFECEDPLVSKHADKWTRPKYPPPLSRAIQNGHVPVVEFLLKQGAADDDGYIVQSAMAEAVLSGRRDMIKLFFDKGAVVRGSRFLPTASMRNLYPPLHVAVEVGACEIAEQLISLGANVDATSDIGVTALEAACTQGHENMVKLLLENKAALDSYTSLGFLQGALKTRHYGIAELLARKVNKADVALLELDLRFELLAACRGGHFRLLGLLLRHPAYRGDWALDLRQAAVLSRHEAIVDRLLWLRAMDINSIDYLGKTALLGDGDSLNLSMSVLNLNLHR